MSVEPSSSRASVAGDAHAVHMEIQPFFVRLRAWFVEVELLSWPSIVLAGFAAFTATVNVGPGSTVHFIDNQWPLNPSQYLYTLQFAWLPQRMGLYNFLSLVALPYTSWAALLQAVGLDSSIQEILTIGLLEFWTGYFGYRILRRFVLRQVDSPYTRLASLAGALCLVNNYYVQSVYWWDFIPDGFVLTAFGLAFVYFSLEFLDRYLRNRAVPLRPLAGMILASTVAFSVSIPFNLSLLALVLLCPPLVWLGRAPPRADWRKIVTFYSISISTIFVTALWWIYPSYMMTQLSPSYLGNAGTQAQSLQTFTSNTSLQTFLSIFTGVVGYPYSAVGHSALVNAVSENAGTLFSVLLVAAVAFALLIRNRSSSARLPYSVAAAFVLALFMTGVNSPLYPWFFDAVFRNGIALTALRTPFVAFGYAYETFWVFSGCLAGVEIARWIAAQSRASAETAGLQDEIGREPGARKSWKPAGRAGLLAVVAVGVILVPTLLSAPAAYVGEGVPGSPYAAHLEVASYELDVASYLEANLHDQYALLFPGGFLNQNGSGAYQAFDILPSLLPNSFLIDNYQQGFVAANNALLDDAYQSLADASTAGTAYASLLTQLAVRYVVIEGNLTESSLFGQATAPNYPTLLGSLNRTSGLELAATIGPDYIYQVGAAPQLVSLATSTISNAELKAGSVIQEVNLTEAFYNSTVVSSPGVPIHSFSPLPYDGQIRFEVNESARESLQSAPFPAPIGPSNPPIIFDGYPLSINSTVFPELVLQFETNAATAIAVSLVTAPEFDGMSSSSLTANTINVVSPYDNLGDGDSSLVPAYGYDHFTSPGSVTTLTADISGLLAGDENRTVDYLLISVWPVVDGAGVQRGTPISQWPGTQSVTILDVGVGYDIYDPPTLGTQSTPLAETPNFQTLNLTSLYGQELGESSNLTPSRHLLPSTTQPLTLSVNQSEKSDWTFYQVGAPFPGGGPPTYLNGVPLNENLSDYEFLDVGLRSQNDTAFSISFATVSNLTNLTTSQLSVDLHPIGGALSNQGDGDPLLFEAYGGLHYTTNSSSESFEYDLCGPFQSASCEALTYLVFEIYYVNASGQGVKGLPVDQWPGTQSLQLSEVSISNYAVAPGVSLAAGTALGLNGPTVVNPPTLLAPDDVVIQSDLQGPLANGTVSFSIANPTQIRVTISPHSSGVETYLVVLHETNAPGWTIADTSGVSEWSEIPIDGALLGFVIRSSGANSRVSFQIVFSPQQAYSEALYGGLAIPILGVGFLVALAVRAKRRGR